MSKATPRLFSAITMLVYLLVVSPSPVEAQPFDFDDGNAPIEVVIPSVVPAIFASVSPMGNDATLVLRITTLVTNAWFDAIAPYHSTAIGVYSNLGRRPAAEGMTDYNRNIAILYTSYRVLNSLLPQHAQAWRDMLTSVGLDPDDDQENMVTPIGIGHSAGNAVVALREHDGMNQLGDEGGCKYNCVPYSDYPLFGLPRLQAPQHCLFALLSVPLAAQHSQRWKWTLSRSAVRDSAASSRDALLLQESQDFQGPLPLLKPDLESPCVPGAGR